MNRNFRHLHSKFCRQISSFRHAIRFFCSRPNIFPTIRRISLISTRTSQHDANLSHSGFWLPYVLFLIAFFAIKFWKPRQLNESCQITGRLILHIGLWNLRSLRKLNKETCFFYIPKNSCFSRKRHEICANFRSLDSLSLTITRLFPHMGLQTSSVLHRLNAKTLLWLFKFCFSNPINFSFCLRKRYKNWDKSGKFDNICPCRSHFLLM